MDRQQKTNKDYYNKNAEKWAEVKTHSFYSENEFRKFVKYFKKGSKILDIGCGYGRDVPLFLGIGHMLKYVGLDISQKFLDIASSRYPQLTFNYGNLLELDTLPKRFDGFWAAAKLQHIQKNDWSVLLKNLEAIMKKGAVVYFSLPNDRPNPASNIDPRHFTIYLKKEIRKILRDRGWEILEEGTLRATRGSAKWTWYICKLP